MTYYQFEVLRDDKWIRVGNRYKDKAVANSWRLFVKNAWNGSSVRLKARTVIAAKDAAEGRVG